jgi:hypothetical protein
MTRFAGAIIVLLVSSVALPAREVPANLRDWARKMEGRLAYGMYIGGKKCGWIVDEIKFGKHDGKEVVRVTSQSYMATLFDGEKSIKEEKSLFCYALTGEGRLVYARHYQKEDGKELTRQATPHGKGMRITTQQGKRTLTHDVSMPKDTLALARELEVWLRGSRKAGDRFVKYSVSWEDADVDQKETYIFKAKKTIPLDGKKTAVADVTIDVHDGKLVSEVFLDGRPVKGQLGGLLSIKLEKEAEAKKLSGAPVDLLDASCVIIDRDLSPARGVTLLKLELTHLGDFKVPPSHRQVFKEEKDRAVLEMKRDFRLDKGKALSQERVKRYTRTTPRLQCDQKPVADLARKIVGKETDVLKKARRIEAWVYRELKKSYSDNAETALEILDNKAGDCTEHSLLFVALARAAGIPAREVGGLAFVKGDKPMFGWHAWAEIHDGHQWVSIDPTWNEVYVDATHIKLSEGPRDLGWANVAGKLKIKVLEVKRRKGKE